MIRSLLPRRCRAEPEPCACLGAAVRLLIWATRNVAPLSGDTVRPARDRPPFGRAVGRCS